MLNFPTALNVFENEHEVTLVVVLDIPKHVQEVYIEEQLNLLTTFALTILSHMSNLKSIRLFELRFSLLFYTVKGRKVQQNRKLYRTPTKIVYMYHVCTIYIHRIPIWNKSIYLGFCDETFAEQIDRLIDRQGGTNILSIRWVGYIFLTYVCFYLKLTLKHWLTQFTINIKTNKVSQRI